MVNVSGMSLRASPIEQKAALARRRGAAVRVGVSGRLVHPEARDRQRHDRAIEDGQVAASVATVLRAGARSEARALVRQVKSGGRDRRSRATQARWNRSRTRF